jgi:hypothetical protein
MASTTPFALRYDNVWIVPAIHYNMESAAHVCKLFHAIRPDAVAVELPETQQEPLIHAASRLPDSGVVISWNDQNNPLYYLCEPSDPSFEALRCALENQSAAYCIDLDVEGYPDIHDRMPDPYSIGRIGLETYWQAYSSLAVNPPRATHFDEQRELHMARRLKELSLRHDKVLFVCGMAHAARIVGHLKKSSFPAFEHIKREASE